MSHAVRWVGAIVALLVANALAVVILIARSGDPSPRIVPDHYRQALDFDRTIAARAASAALGWRAEPRLVAAGPHRGRVELALVDGAGAPLAGAQVEVSVRHRSRATGATIALVEESPGHYAGDVAAPGHGLHELEVRAGRGADHFAAARTVTLEARP